MLWRAPWLRYRFTLLGLAVWDTAALYFSYNLTYLSRLGRWEGVSPGLVVITVIWLCISYLVGRYSPPENTEKNPRIGRCFKTLLPAVTVLTVVIGHSWVYQVVDAQTRFRGFIIPFVAFTSLLSVFGQALRTSLVKGQRQWALLGNRVEQFTISKELATERSSLGNRTTLIGTNQLSTLVEGENSGRLGIAVGNIDWDAEKETQVLLQLRERGEFMIPLLSWCEQELQRIPPELVQSEWLIQAEGFFLRPESISWRVKRFGDVIGALILVAITAPVILLATVGIWLEDRGPILYQQVRSGLYGKHIRIWKLRSMKVNAEQGGAQWATNADPRITRIGRLIRSTRVDELPQLFNVIKGDLSLIGPRPERPEIERDLEISIPNYRIRHWIRPGLSGWAQVCYPYGASIEDSRMKLSYDLYYLRNANLLLDILITMKTIRLVIGAKGATPYVPSQKDV